MIMFDKVELTKGPSDSILYILQTKELVEVTGERTVLYADDPTLVG